MSSRPTTDAGSGSLPAACELGLWPPDVRRRPGNGGGSNAVWRWHGRVVGHFDPFSPSNLRKQRLRLPTVAFSAAGPPTEVTGQDRAEQSVPVGGPVLVGSSGPRGSIPEVTSTAPFGRREANVGQGSAL